MTSWHGHAWLYMKMIPTYTKYKPEVSTSNSLHWTFLAILGSFPLESIIKTPDVSVLAKYMVPGPPAPAEKRY